MPDRQPGTRAARRLRQTLRQPIDAWRASYGRVLRFRRDHGHWPSLRRPQSFNEKLLRRAIYDRRPLLHVLSDKLAVRAWVRERVGDAVHIAAVHFATTVPEALLTAPLPPAFAMKSNHGQGHVHLHVAGEPDRRAMAASAAKWLAWDNYVRRRQWCYKDIPRTVFVEEHLTGGAPPDDTKLFCFDGVPRLIERDTGRFTGMRRDFYDTDWQRLDVAFVDPPGGVAHPPPPNLDRMLDIARRLSAGLDFIRVDLYDLGDRVAFGEMTCLPQNGRGRFTPASFDRELGRMWVSAA